MITTEQASEPMWKCRYTHLKTIQTRLPHPTIAKPPTKPPPYITTHNTSTWLQSYAIAIVQIVNHKLPTAPPANPTTHKTSTSYTSQA